MMPYMTCDRGLWIAKMEKAITDAFLPYKAVHVKTEFNDDIALSVTFPTLSGESVSLTVRANYNLKIIHTFVPSSEPHTFVHACDPLFRKVIDSSKYMQASDVGPALAKVRAPFVYMATHKPATVLAKVITSPLTEVMSRRPGASPDDVMGVDERREIYEAVRNDPISFIYYQMHQSPFGLQPNRPFSTFDDAVRLLAKELLR